MPLRRSTPVRRAPLAGALRLTLASLAAALSACAGADQAADWGGTVDTLAGGTVHVRSPAQGVWRDSAAAWRLDEELRVGTAEGGEPGAFTDVYGLAVDGAGRVYVLDRQGKALQQFAADGRHLRTIGRAGSGPGEFRDPIGLAFDRDGMLWVVDPGNARYAVFDTAGTYRGAYRRQVPGYSVPWRGGFDAEGDFIDQVMVTRGEERASVLVRYRRGALSAGVGELAPTDTVVLPPQPPVAQHTIQSGGGSITTSPPFSPSLAWRLDERGDLWFGGTGEYRIHHQRLGGDTLRVIERAAAPPPVTDADREGVEQDYEWFTRQGGRLSDMTIPATKPHFTGFFTDDAGNLWVRPTRERGATDTRFDVFDADGRFLGTVTSPLRISTRTPVFADGRMYAIVLDENDVAYVARLKVVKDRGRES